MKASDPHPRKRVAVLDTEVTVKGRDFLQEDSPDEIGAALRQFVVETRRQAHGQKPANS